MKSFVQYVLVLGIIVGAVFGLTLLKQNSRTPIEKPVDPVASAPGAISGQPLRMREKTAEWDVDDPQYAAEFELGNGGHYDFLVTNADRANPYPLPLGRLREPFSAIAAADAVFVSASDATAGVDNRPTFQMERTIDAPRAIPHDIKSEIGPATSMAMPGPVFAMAGIANPERFFDDLRAAGWQLVGTRVEFGDLCVGRAGAQQICFGAGVVIRAIEDPLELEQTPAQQR